MCPCIWITSPEETTYILKSILRLASISLNDNIQNEKELTSVLSLNNKDPKEKEVDMNKMILRHTVSQQQIMDVYTGEMIDVNNNSSFTGPQT